MSDTVSMRRMHVALTALYIGAAVLIQIALFLRFTHLALLLLLDNGFTIGVMACLVIMLIYAAASSEAGGGFVINPWAARVTLWVCVVALAISFLNMVRLVGVLTGSGAALTEELFVDVSLAKPVTQSGLEALLRHHLHVDEWFVIVCVLVVSILLAILHVITIVYCARASFPRLGLGSAPPVRPYNANGSNNNNNGTLSANNGGMHQHAQTAAAAAALEGVQLDLNGAPQMGPYGSQPSHNGQYSTANMFANNVPPQHAFKHASQVISSRPAPQYGNTYGNNNGRPGNARHNGNPHSWSQGRGRPYE